MKMLDVPQSGSLAGQTSSRNRYGQYRRTRAIPVNPGSGAQTEARARLASNSAAWRALTDLQRAGWLSLGLAMSRTDSLGQTYTLNGFGAFCSINGNRLAAGDAVVDDAPALITPSDLLTATVTLTDAAFSIAYTPTPLPAGQRLFVFASPQRSAGRASENDYRLVFVTAAAAASPANVFAAYEARLGTPIVANRVFLYLQTYEAGFLSAGLATSAIVA
jgi:hypothetical protein